MRRSHGRVIGVAMVAAMVVWACAKEQPAPASEPSGDQPAAQATISAEQPAQAPATASTGEGQMQQARPGGETSAIFGERAQLRFGDLRARGERFVDVPVLVAPGKLTQADKAFLRPLVDAARVIDDLFWQQASPLGLELWAQVAEARQPLNPYDEQLARMRDIHAGPYDRLDHMKPFLDVPPKPEGGTFYPADLTKQELEAWIAAHPDDKAAFQSPYTVIVREGEALKAVPYSKAYHDSLATLAMLLRKAAEKADSPSLKAFLLARAASCETNDWASSDAAWVDVQGSRFEVTVGPYEVYEDALMGYKAAFEIFITMTDPELSEGLATVVAYLDELEAALPLDDKHRGYQRASASPIFAVALLASAGDTRAGVQTIAFNLPNDEDVREKKGSKKVLLRNVIDAKFERLLTPIAQAVLADDQLPLLRREDFFWHTLLHEIGHGMGPGKIKLADGTPTTVSLALKETYPHIEEAKADTLGLLNSLYLTEKGYFKEPDRAQTTLATGLAGFFRSVRFGVHEAHGKANMVIYSFLKEQGAYVHDAATGRFSVVFDKAPGALRALAAEILRIQATGDYDAAKAFLARYGEMTPEVQAALDKLGALPVDIRPRFVALPVVRGEGNNPGVR